MPPPLRQQLTREPALGYARGDVWVVPDFSARAVIARATPSVTGALIGRLAGERLAPAPISMALSCARILTLVDSP